MNKERVELFLAALESGKYTKCSGRMRILNRTDEGYLPKYHCALGVATEVALDNGLREELRAKGFFWQDDFLFAKGHLDKYVMQWYGFDRADPVLLEQVNGYLLVTPVSRLNDRDKDFWTIAQMGREQWLKDQG